MPPDLTASFSSFHVFSFLLYIYIVIWEIEKMLRKVPNYIVNIEETSASTAQRNITEKEKKKAVDAGAVGG